MSGGCTELQRTLSQHMSFVAEGVSHSAISRCEAVTPVAWISLRAQFLLVLHYHICLPGVYVARQ